ncbi:MAG: peptidylprolyl isomerase [Bacteroidota bacterium]|nr:peptidylprolyl isomerase [Bacteroidota bacterium]MDP4273920.1 peptidylprolyl isomerase [Bacteroidota bacterium]
MRRYAFALLLLFYLSFQAQGQSQIIDQVVAVVGSNMILLSDIESQYTQLKAQNKHLDEGAHCEILQNMMAQKLLLNQAKIDSISVSESQVDMQLNNRIDYFINQIGSKEKLEDYFKKTILEIKNDFRDNIREQLMTQKMQENIMDAIKITPSEVKSFYNNLSQDSIPMVPIQLELAQIMIYPPHDEKAIFDVKQQLLDLRKRILNGESFSALAVLYSEDGSSVNGGEIGFRSKAELDPAYANEAFSLKGSNVSKIVESQFGYHIIQLIERRDDKVNTRHILMTPKVSPESMLKAKTRLDSILHLISIKKDTLNFEMAAKFFSEDKNTSAGGGMLVNPTDNSTKFTVDQIDPADYYSIKDLKINQISAPFESKDENGKKVYKVMMIKSRHEAHRANFKDDYTLLQDLALNHKREAYMKTWIADKQKTTFIHVGEPFKDCSFVNENDSWVK